MTYPNAAAGLKSIYQAKLVGLISIVLVIIPIVQIFAVAALLVAGFLALVGLYQCRKDDPGYNTAFMLVLAAFVINLLSNLLQAYFNAPAIIVIVTLISVVSDVLTLASLYFVCITTNRLLQTIGTDARTIDRGVLVWRLNVICTAILIVCELLQVLSSDIATVFAGFLAIFALIAQLVGSILYILYLRDAYRALQSAVPPEDRVRQMM